MCLGASTPWHTVQPMQPPPPTPELPPAGTTVALYSGGVDSYCMAVLTNPDVLLHVQMGGRYGVAEAARLATRTPPGMTDRLVSIDANILGQFELPDSKVIPGRNAMLTLLASNYGDDIQMGSVDSSSGHDKDPVFCARMNNLFRWMYQPSRWLPDGRHVRLHLPVYELTKTELVGQVLARGHNPTLLAWNTFSCYEPHTIYQTEVWEACDEATWLHGVRHEPCGQCPPCGRKWMALTVYGIDVGYNGKEATRHYMQEVNRGNAPHRSDQFKEDLADAWNGVQRPIPPVYPPPHFVHPGRVRS